MADRAPLRSRLPPEPAVTLALLRVVVAVLIPVAPGFREGARVARWAPGRWLAPEGLGWFVRHIPINGALATAAQVAVAFAALCALVGLRARIAFAVIAVVGFYLYGIAELAGHVWHEMHLLWLAALLAASPCDDVLAIDARRPLDAEGRRYAVPLLAARLLLGAIYFFPGVRKLATSGLDWALSDNLRNQLYWKWAEHGALPRFRIDLHPALLHAGGLFVIAFEISFVFLVLFRRTRPVAAALGLVFHLLAQLIFQIPFASLWLCYVALYDWRPIVRRLALQAPEAGAAEVRAPGALPAALVGAVLLAGAVVQGARGQMRSYPFSCYPTFEWRVGTEMPDLSIVSETADGRQRELAHARDAAGYRTQRQWAEIWSLAGVTAPVEATRLRAYYRSVTGSGPASGGGGRVRFYRVYRSVLPGDGGQLTRPPVHLLDVSE